MTFYSLIHTISHLRVKQVLFQIRIRLFFPRFCVLNAPSCASSIYYTPFIKKNICYKNSTFQFLNISSQFAGWNDLRNGMLWGYNLNYMDWLSQKNMTFVEGEKWINKFIDELTDNKVGLDSYPIALRGVNWIKFISLYYHEISAGELIRWNDSLYSQYRLLEKKVEYHLMGNHVLEDAYSLFIASLYFQNQRFYRKSIKLLYQELKEEVLADGAHFEQSPMYHCILLDRLLDCYNFSKNSQIYPDQNRITEFMKSKAELMLGHLEYLVYQDGSIPLLNDSANGIAPISLDLFEYAKRLGLSWRPIPLKQCGYRKYHSEQMEAIVDVGNIIASYQPGHSHADTFNYELRIGGRPFVVDTGISTYNKTERRQYERGTVAHNTVTVNDQDSSEVWGGFRVGKRARVKILNEESNSVTAVHNGFGKNKLHQRKFLMNSNSFDIYDSIPSSTVACSRIHLSPVVKVVSCSSNLVETDQASILIDGAISVAVRDVQVSTEYNKFSSALVIEILFKDKLKYSIQPCL